MKKLYKALERTFDLAILAGITSWVAVFTLMLYSFFEYPQAYFTTRSDFAALEKVAPMLHNFMLFFIVLAVAMIVVAYICRAIGRAIRKAEKNRR